jgi:parallel beta-helix repeat protein
MLTLAFNVQPVRASGTIYIRANGSIDPPTAPISTVDNITYTLTGNVISDADGIIVERNNIVIDGAGYTVQGGWSSGKGVDLVGRSNVTVKDTNVEASEYGLYLNSTVDSVISGNNITNNNLDGILLNSSASNSISGNNITDNERCGIDLAYSSFNNVSGNGVTGNGNGGIWLGYSSGNSLLNNNLVSNTNGGIILDHCSSNNISDNDITNNIYGGALNLFASCDSTMIGNSIVANYGGGISLSSSSNNTLRTNNMVRNLGDFGVWGETLSDFLNDIDTSNTVEGKPIYYWVSKQDLAVPVDAGYVALVNCTRITVQNLSLTDETMRVRAQGVLLAFTTDSTITKNSITNSFICADLRQSSNNSINENNITNNGYGVIISSSQENIVSENNITNSEHGSIQIDESSNHNRIVGNNIVLSGSNGIYIGHFSNNNIVSRNNIADCSYYGGITLWNVSNNIITENNITNNKYSGISLSNSSDNIFYHNSFSNNTRQVYEWSHDYLEIPPSVNIWDDGYPSGGNYWSDYNGTDLCSGPYQNETGRDGIGDLPYVIDSNNQDNYPLMPPYVPVLGDLNLDGWVNLLDAIEAASAFGSYPGLPNWNSQADLNHDNVVNILDTIILANNFGKH